MRDEIRALDQALATADLSGKQEAALRSLRDRLAAGARLTVPFTSSPPLLTRGTAEALRRAARKRGLID